MSQFLFVYGTLMSTFKNSYSDFLKQNATFIEKGHIPARLYEVGEYPAAISVNDFEHFVVGEIWYISNFEQIISVLDEYEGTNENKPEYQRKCVEALTEEKNKINCWTYFYNLEITSLQEIKGGDYLKWKTK